MAKLFNTRSETIALRSLCSRDPVVSGYIMSHLDDTYFYNDESIEVLQRIQSIFNRTGSMPAFNILVEDIKLSETAREYLAEAESPVKDLTQAEHLVRSLGELRKTRMFYLLARDVLDTLEKSKVDVDKLTDLVSKRISHIHAARTGEADIVHFGKDSNAWDHVKEQLYNDEHNSVIPTGFRTWDDLNGGMIRGSLCLIGGTSGGGKSILANQLAVNQSLIGYRTNMVPLEMSTGETLSRTMSSISGMNSIDIVLHRLASGERDLVWKRMRRFNRKIEASGGQYTVFKPRSDMSMEEIMSAVHSLNCDVTYIDYISLLKGVGGDDSWQKLGEVARFGKIYAEMHNRVVVLLAQVSEEGRVRYSQAIKEHASLGWVFVSSKDSKEKGYLNIQTIKSRNQVAKDFTLKIEYSQTRVSDLDPSEIEKLEAERSQKSQSSAKRTKPTEQSDYKSTDSSDDSLLPEL